MRISILVVLAVAALLCGAAPLMGAELIYSFPLDSDPGWTTQGAWAFGAPTGGGGTTAPPADCGFPDPTSGHTGSYVYGYNLSGNYTASMAAQNLTTTAINCTSVTDTTLVFWRWLGVDGTTFGDYASVQVSNNGADWTTVWANPAISTCEDSWQYCVYDISAVADGHAAVYVRWVMGPTSPTYSFSGWNIDDVQIWSGAPGPYPVYTWNLNATPGWTVEGAWGYGTPTGGGGAYGYPDPTSGHTGTRIYGYNLSGDYPNGMPAYNLTTTAIDCSDIEGTTLVFWRWLGVEGYYDDAYVQVSNDGSTWTTVWANPSSSITESYWQLCSYDISAVADGEATVYIRWVMGPTDGSVYYQGWNIDDIQIWNGPPLPILAWTAYPDMNPGAEYDNTIQALEDKLGGGFLVQEFPTNGQTAGDDTLLYRQLEGKHVFLVPEPEAATTTELTNAGTAFASVLQTFVSNGGTVAECCEWTGREGFLTATGLMNVTYDSGSMAPGTLPVEATWHPVAAGVGSSVTGQNYTSFYTVGSESLPIVTDGAGHAAVAVRDYGAGAVVLLGYDFFSYDSDAAQILANAVQYPRNARHILLYYDGFRLAGVGAEALRRLGYAFTQTDPTDLDQALTTESWDLVVLDNPNYGPMAYGNGYYYDSLVDYLGVWGKSAASSWQLAGQPELAAAYHCAATTTLTALIPVYHWVSDPLFTTPNSVPDLVTWDDPVGYGIDGYKLTVVGIGAGQAGYTASDTAGEAAVVMDIYNTAVIDGFLWDEASQDADVDGVQDVVELVMNQIVHLTKNPYVDMSFTPSATTTGATVNFTGHLSATAYGSTWWYGDGFSDAGTSASHSYTNPGFYSVSFVSGDDPSPIHYSIRTAPRQMVVGFTDAGPGFWACNYIIACYEGGLVGGYDDGYHPAAAVTRAQMAVFVARGIEGGDANVPAGPGTPTFADVGTGYWAYKYVEDCYANGIVGGYDDGYHPEEIVNRAQMAVYAARVRAGSDAAVPDGPGTPTFGDVGTGYWAYKYVEYCYAQSIVGGYADGYHPVENVNRAQMPVYMQRLFRLWMPY